MYLLINPAEFKKKHVLWYFWLILILWHVLNWIMKPHGWIRSLPLFGLWLGPILHQEATFNEEKLAVTGHTYIKTHDRLKLHISVAWSLSYSSTKGICASMTPWKCTSIWFLRRSCHFRAIRTNYITSPIPQNMSKNPIWQIGLLLFMLATPDIIVNEGWMKDVGFYFLLLSRMKTEAISFVLMDKIMPWA